MSEIQSISGVSTSYATGTSSASSTKYSDTKVSFSAILKQLKTGAGPGSGASKDSSEETVTITQVMSDGSVLITVYQGDKIISHTKTKSASPEENPTIMSTNVERGLPFQSDSASTNIVSSNAERMDAGNGGIDMSFLRKMLYEGCLG